MPDCNVCCVNAEILYFECSECHKKTCINCMDDANTLCDTCADDALDTETEEEAEVEDDTNEEEEENEKAEELTETDV